MNAACATLVDLPRHEACGSTPFLRAVTASNPWQSGLPFVRRRIQHKQALYRAGQQARSVFIVHAGTFKTSLVVEDGREQVTGFQLRGDMLGLESIDRPVFACDAIALDVCEVMELPRAYLVAHADALMPYVAGLLAQELRREWRWMLALRTLDAEQRVVAFLLDLADRFTALGYSPARLLLRMTRAELGNFLSLSLETVVRVLSRLDAAGLITVNCRDVTINDAGALASLVPRFAA